MHGIKDRHVVAFIFCGKITGILSKKLKPYFSILAKIYENKAEMLYNKKRSLTMHTASHHFLQN